MAQRIKGQETSLAFTDPDGDVDELGVVSSFEAELDVQILEEGYLGETANRFDDIYNGTSGNVDMHLESTEWFKFSEKIQDRSARRTPASGKFSITSSFQYPDGSTAKVTFEDVFWGPLPLRVPQRGEYVAVSLSWKCSQIRRVL